MIGFLRVILALCGVVAAAGTFPADALAAAMIKTQPPCNSGGDNCFNFGVGIVGLGQFDIRDFAFKAPSKGTAQVSFHGSLLCAADLSAGSSGRPGDADRQFGHRHRFAQWLRRAAPSPGDTAQHVGHPELGLDAGVHDQRGGTQTYRYRVRPLRIDAGSNCFIYNAAFSVVFVP